MDGYTRGNELQNKRFQCLHEVKDEFFQKGYWSYELSFPSDSMLCFKLRLFHIAYWLLTNYGLIC